MAQALGANGGIYSPEAKQYIDSYGMAGAGYIDPKTIASGMDPYMSKYVNDALAPQLRLQDQQFADQNKSFDSQATGAGAFGDTGWGLGRAKLTDSQNAGRAGLIGNAYQTAFNTAIGASAQDQANDINAQTTPAGAWRARCSARSRRPRLRRSPAGRAWRCMGPAQGGRWRLTPTPA